MVFKEKINSFLCLYFSGGEDKMKPTDFAYYLTDYLSKYLPCTVGLCMNTIMSYRDTLCPFGKGV